MTKYVALLRGISPTNPSMRNDKLRSVFESLGLLNVKTVISSGNVLFETSLTDTQALEAMIEIALPTQLSFTSATIIRSREQLQQLVDSDPFKGAAHTQKSYLTVTFFKNKPRIELDFPYRPENKAYKLLGVYDNAICSVVDLTTGRTPDLMSWLEKQFGKQITTRTWKTVGRILKNLE
jgi:uncharacterized protein (DUF1697 family)